MNRFITLITLVGLMSPLTSTRSSGEDQDIKLSPPSLRTHACKPGPWGTLEYHYLYLEAPSSTVDMINLPSRNTVWWFPGKDAEQVSHFLLQSGSPEEEVRACLEFSILYQNNRPFKFFPSYELINEIATTTRQAIYAELRKWPENKNHYSPIIIPTGDISDWFRNSGLRQETIFDIQRLSYPLGKALGFSDIPAVIENLSNDQEEHTLLKALTRTRSLILSLKIEPNTDTQALKEYWSAGYKSKDVLTLFDTVARIDGIESIDITRIIPPTPRKHLYTFPSRSLGLEGTYPDSFWASLNFFNYFPDDQFNDFEKAMDYAKANYEISSSPLTFGDLLIFKDAKSNRASHSCVFIADDIVYSKNGRSLLQPFMLIKLDDLYNQFAISEPPLLEVWTKIER